MSVVKIACFILDVSSAGYESSILSSVWQRESMKSSDECYKEINWVQVILLN